MKLYFVRAKSIPRGNSPVELTVFPGAADRAAIVLFAALTWLVGHWYHKEARKF